MSTYRGLLKKEAYSNIINCLKENNYQCGVEYVVDLACSKNEITNLITFFINYFNNHILNSYNCFIFHFASKLERLDNMPRKKGIYENKIFQETVIDVYILLCLRRPRDDKFDFIKNNVQSIKRDLGDFSFEYKESELINLAFGPDINLKMLEKMLALLYLLENGKHSLAIGLIYIYVTGNDSYNVDDLDMTCFKYKKSIKNKGIAFYIWKLIYKYTFKTKPYLIQVVDDYYTVYNIGLNKKNSIDRVNILLHIAYLITTNKYMKTDTIDNKIKKLKENININAFDLVLQVDEPILQQKEKVQERTRENKKTHDYLKCITFVRDDTKPAFSKNARSNMLKEIAF